MSRFVIRLPSWQRKALTWAFMSLWFSGVLWLGLHYFMTTESDFGPRPHALEPWALRLHGLLVMAALVTLGSLVPVHMQLAWQRDKNRKGGVLMSALCLWLALTGYALWYFASEENQNWLSLLHWLVGLSLPAVLVLHMTLGRRRPAKAAALALNPALENTTR